MSMILDVLVIGTLALCMILYTKRGFIKGLLGLCGCFVAMIAATLTKPMLTPLLEPLIRKLLSGNEDGGDLSAMLEADMTAEAVASVIAFFLLFVLFITAMRLITHLLDRICKLPVLKQANKLLGFFLGSLIGLLYAQILSIFLFTFSDILVVSLGWLEEEAFEGSVVARWMFDHNLFRLLTDLI